MKKLSKIVESLWSDLQDRSSGDVIRKEDDVNHMDFDTFADYIKDNYSEKGDWFAIRESEDGKSRHIEIDIIYRKEIDLSFNVVEGEIYNILVQGNKNYVDIPGLKQIFNVNIIGSSTFSVYEKNWTISNNTFVKLIEFFLKKKTNESLWSDLQDRSSGDVIRKEDNIDKYDIEAFCEYIKRIYTLIRNSEEYIYASTSNASNPYILLPIEGYVKDSDCLRLYGYGLGEESIKSIFIEDWEQFVKNDLKKLEDLLGDEYTIIHDEPHFYGEIKKKSGGKITNSEVIDVIDKILSVVKRPLLKKVSGVTESLWSDLQDRSSGDVVRKEDEFNDICEFINKHYFVSFVAMDNIEFKDDYIHVPIYKVIGLNSFSSVDIYRDKITFSSIDPNKYTSQTLRKFVTYIKDDINQLFDKIKDTYSPEISTFDGMDHWIDFEIKPKYGKITKEFCEEVIDFILNNTTDGNNKILKILEKI